MNSSRLLSGPGLLRFLFLLLLGASSAPAAAVEGSMGIVTGAPGKIMAGTKVLSEVPTGTRLWIFSAKPGWAEVKVPDQETHGWISAKEIEKVEWTKEQQDNLGRAQLLFNEFDKTDPTKREERRKLLDRGMQLERSVVGDDHPNLAETLEHQGYMFKEWDEISAARKCFDEALAINTKALGREHLATMSVVNNLGNLALNAGDYPTALKHFETVLAHARKSGQSDLDLSNILNNMANLQCRIGDYAAARKNYDESLDITRRIAGPQHLSTSSQLNNLGLVQMELAEYPAARECFEQSLAIRRKNLGDKHELVCQTLTNLGQLLHKQGDTASGRKMIEQSLAVYRQLYGNEDRRTAYALNNLANLVEAQGDYAQARKLLEESLAMLRKILGNDHPDIADALHNLGGVAKNLKEFETARKYYDESIAHRRKTLGADHPSTLDVQSSLAILLHDQRDFAAAHKLGTATLAGYQNIFGAEHAHLGGSYAQVAWAEFGEKNYPAAFADMDRSRRIIRKHTQHTLPALSPGEQLQFLEHNYQEPWVDSLSFGLIRREDSASANRAMDWLINGKAIAQESLAAQQLLARDARDPKLAALVAELTGIRQRLASLAHVTPEPDQAEKQQALVFELTADEQRLARNLAIATGQAANNDRWVEFADLRKALPEGSVYIDLVRMKILDFDKNDYSEPHYIAWIVKAEAESNVQLVDLGDAAKIERAVEQARAAIAAAAAKDGALRKEGEAVAAAQTAKELQAAADLVLRPLLPHLADAKQLILSPDGTLWLLPWAALPAGEDKCLLERCAVRYVLSGRDLVKQETSKNLSTSAPAIFTNPDFDLAAPSKSAALNKPGQGNTPRGLPNAAAPPRPSSLPRVAPLPFTAIEGLAAKPILEQLSGAVPQSFEQAQALEGVVKSLRRPKHLLFATHGFFLDKPTEEQAKPATPGETRSTGAGSGPGNENPLLRCGLLLAGCNQPRTAGTDDGILTGMEIVGLDLRGTELVVLSACETGIGRIRNGEGVAGLRQAFQLAGAQSVVSTLWQVPDRDSALIMQDFFSNLAAGQSKADALRNAQLKRIAARKEKSGAAHPFFWAAWTVTGE